MALFAVYRCQFGDERRRSADLSAAYELSKQQAPVVVLESDLEHVGGISRTVNYKNFLFDIDGHRLFSSSREVEDLRTEIAGGDMLDRPRSSGRLDLEN
jgi:protoporphyrinogen oxidase